ncbi:hypothetical protein SEA_MOAB_163 [Streptomyces phage Moab]|nr:hypothetical protein SEA_MOAB_163 [Streptomyces phage Moab]WMI33775.1 hypothetical protein SEA_PATELGO_165 [Streptomyces phage Patelgo]
MAGLPKKMYYVLIKPGGKPLGYGKKGGGVYSLEKNARGQYDHLKSQGCKVELYHTRVDWDLLETNVNDPIEGQEPLW